MKATTTKFTSNGRITIPAALCKKYKLISGRKIKFETEEDGIKIIPLVTPEEIKVNVGFLGKTSQKPGKKGKLLKALMKEKKRERKL